MSILGPMSATELHDALAFLRSYGRGDLRFGEHIRLVRYALDADGALIMPVMVAMQQEIDTVLFVPEMIDGAMELQLTLDPFEERGDGGALADRWRIHHGEPPDVRWARGLIDAARYDGHVIDGAALMVPNPLHGDESALCRHVNQTHRAALPALCRFAAGIGVDDPVMVAVDPDGALLRGRFDVYRVPFPETATDAAHAERMLDALVAEATAAEGPDAPDEAPVDSVGERAGDADSPFDELDDGF